MPSLLRKGLDVYRDEGLSSVVRKGSRAGGRKVAKFPIIDDALFHLSARRLAKEMDAEDDLDDILNTAFNYRGFGRYRTIKPLQIRSEFEVLIRKVEELKPNVVMEIGTANGGTFYIWSRYIDSASTIISLDLPGGEFGGGYTRKKTQFFDLFNQKMNAEFIRRDSHKKQTRQIVQHIISEDKIDFLFIDGDHSYKGVKQDFEMYSPLVQDGGLIAFHDIVPGPKQFVGGVPKFWQEIKKGHDTEEIISDRDSQEGYGIGVLSKG